MRGVFSYGMVMCASTEGKCEFIDPPSGSVPGDRIVFDNYPGVPDEMLNPKKKVWEKVQPDLHTDVNRVAMYKDDPFTVKGKGICTAPTLSNVNIK
jgi:aminoacyl tRNA synthase complex-interacting multifunctional protein 1